MNIGLNARIEAPWSPAANSRGKNSAVSYQWERDDWAPGRRPCSSVAQSCPTLHTLCPAARQASLSFAVPQSLLKLTSIESVMPSNISSSVVPLFSCPQSFPASGSFPMSQFFTSGGRSIGVSASGSVLPVNIQDWFPLGWTGWISLLSKGLSRVFSSTSLKASILQHSAFFMVQLSHPYMTTGKNKALTIQNFVKKVMSLLFNMLSRLVIAFLPRSKHLLISWLQSPSAVILEPRKIVSWCFHCFLIYLPWRWDQMPWC